MVDENTTVLPHDDPSCKDVTGRDAAPGSVRACQDAVAHVQGDWSALRGEGVPLGRRVFRWGLAAIAAAFAVAAAPASAAQAQAESCTYDPSTLTLTATIASGSAASLTVVGGQLWFGFVPAACGDATTVNTNSIAVSGEVGSTERLVLDLSGGVLGPGATGETNIPEIEISVSLGDLSDSTVVIGTDVADSFAPGQHGIALNPDGDVDVTLSPSTMPLEFYGMGGDDVINGRGQWGAGLHYLGPLHIEGGDGDDGLLRGSSEPDIVLGGPGNDRVEGQDGADVVEGGSGDDSQTGGGETTASPAGPEATA